MTCPGSHWARGKGENRSQESWGLQLSSSDLYPHFSAWKSVLRQQSKEFNELSIGLSCARRHWLAGVGMLGQSKHWKGCRVCSPVHLVSSVGWCEVEENKAMALTPPPHPLCSGNTSSLGVQRLQSRPCGDTEGTEDVCRCGWRFLYPEACRANLL